MSYSNRERRWIAPSRRASGYAEERKDKVHRYGPKKDKDLSEYEKGVRSGYLLCQSDHAGIYRYYQAIGEGKSVDEAIKYSRQIGKPTKKENSEEKTETKTKGKK